MESYKALVFQTGVFLSLRRVFKVQARCLGDLSFVPFYAQIMLHCVRIRPRFSGSFVRGWTVRLFPFGGDYEGGRRHDMSCACTLSFSLSVRTAEWTCQAACEAFRPHRGRLFRLPFTLLLKPSALPCLCVFGARGGHRAAGNQYPGCLWETHRAPRGREVFGVSRWFSAFWYMHLSKPIKLFI